MPKKTSRVSKAAKEPTDQNPNYIGVISGKPRVLWGAMPADEEGKYLLKSARSDYGRVIDIRIPHGYHAQVRKSWEMYETDRLFRYLIDRCEDFAANGFEWEVPVEEKGNILDWLKRKIVKETPEQKERKVWDRWAARLNKNVNNVLPGIDEVNKWIVKQLLLSGMAPMQFEWGKIEVDGVEYEFPIKMMIHNPLSIALDREKETFMKEEMYLKLSIGQKKIIESEKYAPIGLNSFVGKGADWMPINLMGVKKGAKNEGFALKYKWTPADNTALVYGRNVHVGQGLYPTPPFVGLYEVLILRRALTAADLAILDGVINFILDWEIGDNTVVKDKTGRETMPNQPRPARYDAGGAKIEKSSIEMAKEIITSDTRGNVMQLFHPYYYKLNIKMPDTSVLLNAVKYIQSTVEVYEAFGILLSPSDKRMNFEGINTQNFEQMLDNMRLFHIRRFWEALAEEIVERNKDKLRAVPNMIFKPLNTKTEAFKSSLLNLAKIGKISTESLLQGHGLDKKVEVQRIALEIAKGEKALTDAQVPVSFVQAKVKPPKLGTEEEEGEEDEPEEIAITPLSQTGRPKEK